MALSDLATDLLSLDQPALDRFLATATPDEIEAVEAAVNELYAIRQAEAGQVEAATRWRCDRETCDGSPHEGFHHCAHPLVSPDHVPSCRHARTAQRPPPLWPRLGKRVHLLRGGRGSGKSKSGSWGLAELILSSPPGEYAVVAPTFADARDICMEGSESGLIVALGGRVGEQGRLIEKGPYITAWNRTNGQLRLLNGSVVYTDGADDGAYRIQGHNLRAIWCDEIGLWKKWKAAWDESIRYAVRLAPAKIIATGTPKHSMPGRALMRRLIKGDAYTEGDGQVHGVQLKTEDNAPNLDPSALASFLASKGTRLERQELEGELLEDVEGALWKSETLDLYRTPDPRPEGTTDDDPFGIQALFALINPTRVGIGVDPAVSFGEDSDEHGIIVAAKGADGDIYVFEDLSKRCPVTAWPPIVMDGFDRCQADRIIGEANNGGDYIEATVRAAGFQGGYEKVTASRGKTVRAEPLAQFAAQGHMHIVGYLPELESQLCSWVPGESDDSPDRLDALVWVAAWLHPRLSAGWGSIYTPYTPEEREEQKGQNRGWARTDDIQQPTKTAVPTEAITPARKGYFG